MRKDGKKRSMQGEQGLTICVLLRCYSGISYLSHGRRKVTERKSKNLDLNSLSLFVAKRYMPDTSAVPG